MPSSPEPSLLTPALFHDCCAAWVSFVSSASSDELAALFSGPGGSRLPFLSIAQEPLVWLLSTPNLHQIKVRLVLLPASSGQQSRFSAALYATDHDGKRQSAYYLADAQWQPAAPPLEGQVPQTLSDTWLANWVEASPLTAAMFTTGEGPLQGYNFEMADFMDPLFAVDSLPGVALQLHFGLHTYYLAADAPTPAQLFGLVLRLHGPALAGAAAAPFYDLGTAVPPGH